MSEATITHRAPPLQRAGGALIATFGAAVIAVAILADLRQGSRGGAFGLAQALVAMVGLGIATLGVDLVRGRAADWMASLLTLRTEALPLLAMTVQIGLVVYLTGWFQLENPAFARLVLPFTAFGFVLHHLLPLRHRLTYFAVLSLLGFVLVLGWVTAAWLVALTLGFVALCHLPIPWLARVAVLVLAGTVLGILRVMPTWVPFSSAVWPILGSILMFRLMVYAYDVRNAKEPVPAKWSVAYFFLMPNVVFPLFPVIDFATFRRTYYDRDAMFIYQRGIDWMARGLLHLIIYRAVYQHLTLAPGDVTTGAQLVQYMVSTFLLYLRVSGTFHLIVGILHLFGFRLPETHRFFYLASTFTDFWRRINIYWKDFMMKLVFYPVYFPLRKKHGETTALVVGTLSVFLITWLTHSYQWFWILGKWLLSWTDGLFWAILGVLLVVNSLWEARHGRKRALPGAARRRVREALAVAIKATFVFATICTLWSLWGSPTLADWFSLMSVERFTVGDWAAVVGLLAAVAIAAFIGELTGRSQGDADRGATAEPSWKHGMRRSLPQLAALTVFTTPMVLGSFDYRVREFARDMRLPELNKVDAANLQRGYYENLQGVSLQNSQLWELYAQRPPHVVDIWKSGIMRERPDYLARDMKPFFAMFDQGVSIRTNRWGMRDRDYDKTKPAGVYRVALLGQSYVAGDGVNNGESFEELVENRLVAERPGAAPVQILNFSVGAYSVVQQLLQLEERVWSFSPDVVVLFGHEIDAGRLAEHVARQALRGVDAPYPWLREIVARANITPGMREADALSRLAPYQDELLSRTHQAIVEACRARNVDVIWVYLAMPERGPSRTEIAAIVERVRTAGFHALNWSDVYDGVQLQGLQRSQWDFHPNAAGHRLIAERFYRDLTTDSTFGVRRLAGHAAATDSRRTGSER